MGLSGKRLSPQCRPAPPLVAPAVAQVAASAFGVPVEQVRRLIISPPLSLSACVDDPCLARGINRRYPMFRRKLGDECCVGLRGVFGFIKRELRRRCAIEAVSGHMKTDGHLGLPSQGPPRRCRQRRPHRRRPEPSGSPSPAPDDTADELCQAVSAIVDPPFEPHAAPSSASHTARKPCRIATRCNRLATDALAAVCLAATSAGRKLDFREWADSWDRGPCRYRFREQRRQHVPARSIGLQYAHEPWPSLLR